MYNTVFKGIAGHVGEGEGYNDGSEKPARCKNFVQQRKKKLSHFFDVENSDSIMENFSSK